jgi:hypothetical protein
MARLMFTQQLARFTMLPRVETDAGRLRAGLDSAFAANRCCAATCSTTATCANG